jgi:hypothetical protein
MIIADKEGQQAICDLCDLALKVGGLKNRDIVNEILNSVQPLEQKSNDKQEQDG